MKKTKALLVVLFLFSFSLFANIREAVCIVKPEYSKELGTKMNKIAVSFENFGYEDMSEIFTKSVEKGSFGSGFVYKHEGKYFVITNQHVIAYADLATIEIENTQGDTIKKLEHCKVIASSEELDLAIIELPSNAGITQSLDLYEGSIKDGVDVFSAGYPGLIDNPAWQLGKGNISNAMLKIPELVDPKKSYFIQHSAPIDPGNSGGPLLIPNSSSKNGYQVIGVNSIKAVYRETTNFAIPSSTVKRFLKTSFTGVTKNQKESMFKEAAKSFIDKQDISDEIDKKYLSKIKQLMLMIDNDYALENGYSPLKSLLLKAPSKIRASAIGEIKYSFPADALKYAIAYEILKTLQESPELKLEEAKMNGNNAATANYTLNEDKLSANWIFINNTWKIKEYSLNGKSSNETEKNEDYDKSESKSVEVSMPYIVDFCLSYNFLHLPINKNSSGGSFSIGVHANYFGGGLKIGLQQRIYDTDVHNEYQTLTRSRKKISTLLLFFGEFHVPINFTEKQFAIIPYVNAGLGARFSPIYGNSSFGSLRQMFAVEISPGIKFSFNKTSVPIVAGVGFLASRHANAIETRWLKGFNIFVGIGYGY